VTVAGLNERSAAVLIAAAMKPYLRFPSVMVRVVQQGQSIFFAEHRCAFNAHHRAVS
jgi:protein involved in polysaccharide export with SLBB domain